MTRVWVAACRVMGEEEGSRQHSDEDEDDDEKGEAAVGFVATVGGGETSVNG